LTSFTPAFAKDPLSRFAVSTARMEEFAAKCVQLPTQKEMETDVQKWIEGGRKKGAPLLSVLLDGFPLNQVSEPDFKVLRDLTVPRGAHSRLKDEFRFDMKIQDRSVLIERACVSEKCGAKGKEKKYDLSAYQKPSEAPCTSSLCGAKRIFGDLRGLLILWAYVKFGTNLSPFSDVMADPKGLDDETLRAIIAASLLIPDHLKDVSLRETGFFRFMKGATLSFYNGQKVVANSFGGVFDPIDELNFAEKIYFFIHELAHRARLRQNPGLDESPEWLKAAGWKDLKTPPQNEAWASAYARVNPFEDFAETYSLYRLDPQRLKKVSPDRYDFMKTRVFDGLEYDQDLCRGSRPLRSARR
jgi:hypothetical protein